MSVPVIDIERVVREVLAELGIAQMAGEGDGGRRQDSSAVNEKVPSPPTSVPVPPSASPPSQSRDIDSHSGNELVVSSRVVTMADLTGRLNGARRVVVSREAVVTPAVRDELLRRGIALTHADSSNGHLPPAVRLVMITTGTDFDPAALVAGLGRDGLKTEHSALNCLIAATGQLATEVAKPNTLGVLLTRHTAAGLCLANRLGGVRAITGADAPAVAAAAAAVGANLLVADPQAGTFFQLKQMVTEFGRGGVRPCPTVFRAKLA
jgi:hypothetical protein